MEKLRMTRKDAEGRFCFRAGYCELSEIMRGVDPIGYNSGVYGWNWDCYHFGGVTITTGYRGMVGRNMPRGIVAKYRKQAESIAADYYREDYKYRYNYDHMRARLERMRARFAADLRAL